MKFPAAIFLALFALAPLSALSLGPEPSPNAGLDPSLLSRPPVDGWPTYNGDYSGRRFSTLTKINDQNVKALSLAWMYQLPRNSAAPGGRLAGTPLVVNGLMYITSPAMVPFKSGPMGREPSVAAAPVTTFVAVDDVNFPGC